MRDILFKAKRIDNGEWVYGNLLMQGTVAYIVLNVRCNEYFEAVSVKKPKFLDVEEVDPDTVCEYTGLTDINGKRIFEADLISIPNSSRPGLPGEVYWGKQSCMFFIRRIGYNPILLDGEDGVYEIVGNRFDNPELLNP